MFVYGNGGGHPQNAFASNLLRIAELVMQPPAQAWFLSTEKLLLVH